MKAKRGPSTSMAPSPRIWSEGPSDLEHFFRRSEREQQVENLLNESLAMKNTNGYATKGEENREKAT